MIGHVMVSTMLLENPLSPDFLAFFGALADIFDGSVGKGEISTSASTRSPGFTRRVVERRLPRWGSPSATEALDRGLGGVQAASR